MWASQGWLPLRVWKKLPMLRPLLWWLLPVFSVWFVEHCLLSAFIFMAFSWGAHLGVSVPSLCEDTGWLALGSTLMASF